MERPLISPYNPQWPALFSFYEAKLKNILGTNSMAIYHIGSTSVVGLSAKPIIDILVSVFSLENVDAQRDKFENEGFQWRGEYGIEGRRYFVLEDSKGQKLCHIQAFQAASLEIERHLAFRDLLRNDLDKKNEYETLKQKLVAQFADNKGAYQAGKHEFISTTTAIAVKDQNQFRIPVQVYVWVVCKKGQETKFLLLKRSISTGGFWQGVTGAPFAGEAIEASAARELFEETEIKATNELQQLNYSYCFPVEGKWKKAFRTEVEQIFEIVYYTALKELVEPKLSHEHDDFRWCTYDECLALLKWDNNKESLKILQRRVFA